MIGAGPAGSRVAARLAGGGHCVSLIDKSFDREKPCGGGVPWAGLEQLAWETESRLAAPAVSVQRIVLESPDGETVEVRLPRPVAVFSRRSLDRALLETARRAGAELVEDRVIAIERQGTVSISAPTSVAHSPTNLAHSANRPTRMRGGHEARSDRNGDVASSTLSSTITSRQFLETSQSNETRDPNGSDGIDCHCHDPAVWTLTLASGQSLEVDHIIGADGARSLVRRRLGRPLAQGDLSQALGWYAHGRTSDTMVIRFDPEIRGYLWIFPRTDHLAIGACGPLVPGATEAL